MLKISFLKRLSAFAVSIAVTLFLLVAVAHLSGDSEVNKDKKTEKNVFIPIVKKKIKPVQKKRIVTKETKQAAKAVLPALNLPSSIQAPELLAYNELPSFDNTDARNEILKSSFSKDKNQVLTEEMVDKVPEILFKPRMTYPPAAHAEGIEGSVTLKILVDENGTVREVVVLGSNPVGVFEESAINDVKKWRFKSAMYRGKAVPVWVKEKITFELD